MALVELLNSLGVALYANPSSSQSQQETGSRLTLAALALQLIVILVFGFLAGVFHWRCLRAEIRPRAITTPLTTLYVSMALILVRCVYRLVEHSGNVSVHLDDPESLKSLSPLLRYEWFFYVFEATLMLLNSLLWNIWNPGRYLPRDYHVHLAQDGRTELSGQEKPDDRPFFAKVLSILTLGVFFRRKHGLEATGELHDYPPRD